MTFQAHKSSNTQPDMIQYRTQSAALSAFNQTLLLQAAMIHFNPPRTASGGFSFRFGHFLKARRPEVLCAVCGANPKYFDFSETCSPTHRAIAAGQSGIGYGLQPASVDIDLPVRFQARQKMPAQRAHQFQIFNRAIPTVETNQVRIETPLVRRKRHFREMVVFGFTPPCLYQIRDNQPEHNALRPSRAR